MHTIEAWAALDTKMSSTPSRPVSVQARSHRVPGCRLTASLPPKKAWRWSPRRGFTPNSRPWVLSAARPAAAPLFGNPPCSPRDDFDQRAFADDVVDLNFNYPSLPEQAGLLRNALRGLASSGDLEALLRYQSHGGRPHERASVAIHLEQRGLSVPADRVLIVSGAQHGLAVAALAMLKPGDVIAVDALTYPDSRCSPRYTAWSWRRYPQRRTVLIWTRLQSCAPRGACGRSTRCRR